MQKINLKNGTQVTLFDLPPDDFNMLTASDSELKKYGIPVKPRENDKMMKIWNRLAKKKLTIITPSFPQKS